MAKLKVYRDTIGRCEPPSMLWDAVRNPYAPSVRPEPALVQAKDQAVQKRINKEVYNRLSHTQVAPFFHVFFKFFAFLFEQLCFIVGLPLYFVLCILPHWCCYYLILPVYKFTARHLGRFSAWLGKWVSRFGQFAGRVFMRNIGIRIISAYRRGAAFARFAADLQRRAVFWVRGKIVTAIAKFSLCRRALLIGVCYLLAVAFALIRLFGLFLSYNMHTVFKRYQTLAEARK
jgi:hypothetical protein